MDAVKQRREEGGDEGGFSLIELIIVVVIIGILAAVAVPIFLNIQAQARDSQAQSAAANGATQAAVALTQDPDDAAYQAGTDIDNLEQGDVTQVTVTKFAKPDIDTICVTATVAGGTRSSWAAGPGVAIDETAVAPAPTHTCP
ncbi:prepilin-type N-terminal cleavage/methylation domain-containing protein [Microbacterium sp. NPDC056736]|uniref:prepilin-type N-terminal cleavage/methylation domain-containing protein n=1 Tax=Microbacterium sp. NPDC056736 TaxID=3345932 RepID=UPI00366DCD64